MVYFEQHVIVKPETEALVHSIVQALKVIGYVLSMSIVALALSLFWLSYVLWAKDHKEPVAHRDHQRIDGKKHE